MTKKRGYILGILLTGIIGAIFNWFFCCGKGINTNITKNIDSPNVSPAIIPKPLPTHNGFVLKDLQGDFNFATNDHFNFNSSNFSIVPPISGKIDDGILKLKDYLKENPRKTFTIFGEYTSAEKNTSAYPNLGIARANTIKNYLVNKGIPSAQLNTKGKLNDSLIPDKSLFYGPVSYAFTTTENTEDTIAKKAKELEDLRNEILAHPLALHFETNSSDLNLSTSDRAIMAKISTYLDKSEGSSIKVTGHTDSTGDFNKNLSLGLARATRIKKYLITNQIAPAKIEVATEGSNKPIATNGTAQGRAKNRRVAITLN